MPVHREPDRAPPTAAPPAEIATARPTSPPIPRHARSPEGEDEGVEPVPEYVLEPDRWFDPLLPDMLGILPKRVIRKPVVAHDDEPEGASDGLLGGHDR